MLWRLVVGDDTQIAELDRLARSRRRARGRRRADFAKEGSGGCAAGPSAVGIVRSTTHRHRRALPPPPAYGPGTPATWQGAGPYRNLPRARFFFPCRFLLRSFRSAQSPSHELHYLSSRSYLL